MIPSRGALRALPQQKNAAACRRLPAQNTSRLACKMDSITSRRHISSSTRSTSSLLSSPLRLRSPTLAISTTTTTTGMAARPLSLWPFRSSKPSTPPEPAPVTPELTPEPTPEPTLPLEPTTTTAAAAPLTTPSAPIDTATNPELAAILSETLGETPSTDVFDPSSATTSILDMPEHIGYLAALGIDFGWGPSSTLTWLVEHLHVYSGFPWWGTIMTTALLMRVLVSPLSLRQSEAMRRVTALNGDEQYRALTNRMMAMVREKTAMQHQAEFQTIRKMLKERKREAGVKMTDMWIPMLIQIPMGFAMWRLLRTMADIPVPGLETGGLLWFKDLALADPFFILPMVNPALVYMMNRANAAFQTESQVKQGKRMFYIMGPVSFFFTLWMPAGLQLYFISTFTLTALQTFALRNAAVRNALGLPPWTPPPPPPPPSTTTTLDATGAVYQAPRGTSALAPVASEAAPAKKVPVGDRLVKAVAETVPWAPTPEQKINDEKERKMREADEAEKRLEELQRERRRREFENRFS